MAELQMLLAMTNLPGSAAGPELCFYFSLTIYSLISILFKNIS